MSEESKRFRSQFEGYPPELTAKYEVLECLSATENGQTLLVRERGTNAYRIAKVAADGAFEAERQALGTLSHPGLPQLLEWIPEGCILVRSFVEGKPLDQALAERPLREDEVVEIGVQLCDVLHYLHTQSPPVIHRDVKPQNVILGPDGKVTLIDFGIARTYKENASKDTAFSGTSDFALPEQYGFAQTDARADIYALGMLLKFLLTGGNLEGRVANRRLRRIVARCTAFSPRMRYPSAQAVKRALLHADGRRARRLAVAALTLAALCGGFLVGRYALPYTPPPKAAAFAEPVVEQAARLALDRPEGELLASELAGITELYIVQDEAADNADAFFAALSAWQAQGFGGSGPRTLSDLALFTGLQRVYVAGGSYAELDGLAGCAGMEHVELYNNDGLTDISALAGLTQLRYVGLITCNRVQDISPLEGHELLMDIDLTGYQTAFDPAPLERMGDLYTLMLNGNAEAYRYVHDMRVGWLRLSDTGIASLEPLRTVTGLWKLELARTPLASLEGIEAHGGLQVLNIAYTAVTDLSPLLRLPGLTELTLSANMDASVLSGMEGLTLRYE